MKVLHWSELPGNKFLLKLDPAMLDGCFFAEQTVRRIGVKRTEAPERFKVHYDRDYVITKLLIEVIQPLKIESSEDLIALMMNAWYESHNTNFNYEHHKAG